MSTALDTIKKSATYVEPAIAALEAIQMATGVGGALAGTALQVVDSIVKSFIKGVNNNAAASDITAEIERQKANLVASIAANDAAADKALNSKFPTVKVP